MVEEHLISQNFQIFNILNGFKWLFFIKISAKKVELWAMVGIYKQNKSIRIFIFYCLILSFVFIKSHLIFFFKKYKLLFIHKINDVIF